MKKLDRQQAAVLSLFTGILCGPFSDMHKYASDLLGEPIFTHQFADEEFVAMLKEKARPDFMMLLPEEMKNESV